MTSPLSIDPDNGIGPDELGAEGAHEPIWGGLVPEVSVRLPSPQFHDLGLRQTRYQAGGGSASSQGVTAEFFRREADRLDPRLELLNYDAAEERLTAPSKHRHR